MSQSAPTTAEMTERFSKRYEVGQAKVLLDIERNVCGCDYGGTSWTTRDEADIIAAGLGLKPGVRLLEVGAGSGWPGLYLAKSTGCDVTLVDLPLSGLQIARDRAQLDQHNGATWVSVGDGTKLPFQDKSFDAVFHSDVLCCLPDKLAVLKSCNRVLRASGKMVFPVIYIAPGLSEADYQKAVEGGPPFVDTPSDYPTLLDQAGWQVIERVDQTDEFLKSVKGFLDLEEHENESLTAVLGAEAYSDALARRRAKMLALEKGLLRRELFSAIPRLKS